jgi:hypothetical protein
VLGNSPRAPNINIIDDIIDDNIDDRTGAGQDGLDRLDWTGC